MAVEILTDLGRVKAAIDDELRAFLEEKRPLANESRLSHVVDTVSTFVLGGGKRLRPLLCYFGWRAAGGEEGSIAMLRAAASLELFHAFALIHDDVIDGADTRRGKPTLHRLLAERTRPGRTPRAATAGEDSAILFGDLVMVWSDEMLHSSGHSPARLQQARPILDAMRTELMYGQYLDVLGNGQATADVEGALRIAQYKSGRYTVQRPLQLGAALAGGTVAQLQACAAYGIPIGEAFQLRDDQLGVFGDPEVTGKSGLSDLRDGKSTALLALAMQLASPPQRAQLTALVGNESFDEAGADVVRQIMVESGAFDAVERMIAERVEQGLAVLDSRIFTEVATEALRELADSATKRLS